MNDDRRRGRVGAFVTMVRNDLGELDDALVTGTRVLATARRLGDVRLGILITSCLDEGYYYRGEYERVVELAAGNLAVLRADWVSEYLGQAVVRTRNVVFQLPAAVASSAWALAQLGEASEALDRLREGEPLLERHLGLGKLYRRSGDAIKAREHLATAVTMYREMGMHFWLEQVEVALKEGGQ